MEYNRPSLLDAFGKKRKAVINAKRGIPLENKVSKPRIPRSKDKISKPRAPRSKDKVSCSQNLQLKDSSSESQSKAELCEPQQPIVYCQQIRMHNLITDQGDFTRVLMSIFDPHPREIEDIVPASVKLTELEFNVRKLVRLL
jgi:hypothetical protein